MVISDKVKAQNVANAAHALMYGVKWDATDEGHNFWVEVWENLLALSGHLTATVRVDFVAKPEAYAKNAEVVASSIMGDFTWSETKEGGAYWCNVYDRLWSNIGKWRGEAQHDADCAELDAMAKAEAKAKPERKRERPPIDPYDVERYLRKRGWEQIGSGFYSRVYGKPGSDQVVKICNGMDSWPEYVKWATDAGYAGKFAPKVHSLKVFNKGTRYEFYVARMDRLEATINQLGYRGDSLAEDFAEVSGIFRNALRGGRERELKPGSLAERLHSVRKAYANEKFAGLEAFCKDFAKHFDGCSVDDHDGNWMVKDGRVFLTDPLTETGRKYSRDVRIKSTANRMAMAA